MNSASTPQARYASARSSAASSPSTASASVRARISVPALWRASSAARSLPHISAVGITVLPSRCPQRFGKALVLELDHRGAGALEAAHRALHVERVAEAGVGIDDDRHAPRAR
jgi:hypothetical protein